MSTSYAIAMAQKAREEAKSRAKTDLFFLLTEILDRTLLTETFHKPICKRIDKIRKRRKEGKGKDDAIFLPRHYYKTTIREGQAIQDFLNDPAHTITWWHLVEDHAIASGEWIGQQLMKNLKLRKLFPEGVLPSPMAKRFMSNGGFRLRSNFDRAPSFRAWGVGSEATGGHSRELYLDDIIGRSTIVNNQLHSVKSWYQNTACPVLGPDGWKNASGTRWHSDDIYGQWLKSDNWDCLVRAAYEKDGKPDRQGEPIFLERKQLERLEDEMGQDFAPQMMNDPVPPGELPWNRDCETIITLKEAAGQGVVIALCDPAPAKVGSVDTRQATRRGDGTKDEWAWAIVKLRRVGMRREVILLDGDASRDWDLQEGFDRGAELMRKWHVKRHAIEHSGSLTNIYPNEMRNACRRNGVVYSPLILTGQRNANSKNVYFSSLASMASADEFMICDSVPEKFMEGFLDQCRNWRPSSTGNGLRYDDRANVVSFATDPAVLSLAPYVDEEFTWSPYKEMDDKEEAVSGTRYVQW